jgi:hypothetical protein
MLTEKQKRKTLCTAEGHLLWLGGLANGYPAIKRGNNTLYLKRLQWEESHGAIPAGAVVFSSCGERTCIEPAHLALGAPGRYPTGRAAPESHEDRPGGEGSIGSRGRGGGS